MTLTNRLEKAIRIAGHAHRNQKRKGSDLPYIIHPYSVMILASEQTNDEDVLIACLLHDVLEDVPEEYSQEQMRADFGETVVDIVLGVTKNSDLKDWKQRSDAYLAHLEYASTESVIVSAADKIHNMISILEDYRNLGEKVWDKFNSNKDQQLWWYESVERIVKKRLPGSPLSIRFSETFADFQTVKQ